MSSEAATVSGIVARVGGISRRRSAWDGSLAEASSFDDLDLELGGKTIDLHHDGRPIGELVYCELGSDDRFRVVGVVEGLQLDKIDGHLRELRARDARQPEPWRRLPRDAPARRDATRRRSPPLSPAHQLGAVELPA
jgi:hypothetical protein